MDWKDEINADLIKGFSKSDLELLIGLPKNTLASLLTDKKKISKKSLLKIEKWNSSEKCSPLDVERMKVEMALAKHKLENNGNESGKRINVDALDSIDLGDGEKLTDKQIEDLAQNAIKNNPTFKVDLGEPTKMIGEKALDFNIRLAEWKENQKK